MKLDQSTPSKRICHSQLNQFLSTNHKCFKLVIAVCKCSLWIASVSSWFPLKSGLEYSSNDCLATFRLFSNAVLQTLLTISLDEKSLSSNECLCKRHVRMTLNGRVILNPEAFPPMSRFSVEKGKEIFRFFYAHQRNQTQNPILLIFQPRHCLDEFNTSPNAILKQ